MYPITRKSERNLQIMTKHFVAATVSALLLTACAAPQHPPGAQQWHTKTFQTDAGPLALENFSFYAPSSISVAMNGTLRNNTAKHWRRTSFSVDLFDRQHAKIGNKIVFVEDIAPGAARPFGQGIENEIATTYGAKMDSFDIKYLGGVYDVNYIFTLDGSAADQSISDSKVKIRITPSRENLGLFLTNLTSETIRIDWSQAAYVDTAGISHSVIRGGTKFIDKDRLAVPTNIAPHASVNETVLPSDYVTYVSANVGWSAQPLLPDGPKAEALKGKDIALYLPLLIDGKAKTYRLELHIANVRS